MVDSEAYGNWRRGAVAAGHKTEGQLFERLYSHDNGLDGILINSRDGRLVDSRLDDNGMTPGPPRHGFYMYSWKGGASGWEISGNELIGNRDSGGRIAGAGNHVRSNYVSGSPYGFFVVDSDGVNEGQQSRVTSSRIRTLTATQSNSKVRGIPSCRATACSMPQGSAYYLV